MPSAVRSFLQYTTFLRKNQRTPPWRKLGRKRGTSYNRRSNVEIQGDNRIYAAARERRLEADREARQFFYLAVEVLGSSLKEMLKLVALCAGRFDRARRSSSITSCEFKHNCCLREVPVTGGRGGSCAEESWLFHWFSLQPTVCESTNDIL
jgi:hypothetical protein